ncbi:hypothetical protein PR048_027954 [Dryococelus australis]|uniref:Uncharacterized protein n=1 Tax=Dryococelus australis TaxID=614101 RepID=A0ABQ9GHW1_9NEOP|nr:hypothetical protein PR048_027954 [Dryococelus australis]
MPLASELVEIKYFKVGRMFSIMFVLCLLTLASSGTIPTCENLGVAELGIEPGSPCCEASRLTAKPHSPRTLDTTRNEISNPDAETPVVVSVTSSPSVHKHLQQKHGKRAQHPEYHDKHDWVAVYEAHIDETGASSVAFGLLCVVPVPCSFLKPSLHQLPDRGSRARLPLKANRAQVLVVPLSDIRTWESCWTMQLVGGLSSRISCFPRPCIPALLHTHLASPSSALETVTSSHDDLPVRSALLQHQVGVHDLNEGDDVQTALLFLRERLLHHLEAFPRLEVEGEEPLPHLLDAVLEAQVPFRLPRGRDLLPVQLSPQRFSLCLQRISLLTLLLLHSDTAHLEVVSAVDDVLDSQVQSTVQQVPEGLYGVGGGLQQCHYVGGVGRVQEDDGDEQQQAGDPTWSAARLEGRTCNHATSRLLWTVHVGCQAGKQLANSWHAPGTIAGAEVAPLTSHSLPITGPGVLPCFLTLDAQLHSPHKQGFQKCSFDRERRVATLLADGAEGEQHDIAPGDRGLPCSPDRVLPGEGGGHHPYSADPHGTAERHHEHVRDGGQRRLAEHEPQPGDITQALLFPQHSSFGLAAAIGEARGQSNPERPPSSTKTLGADSSSNSVRLIEEFKPSELEVAAVFLLGRRGHDGEVHHFLPFFVEQHPCSRDLSIPVDHFPHHTIPRAVYLVAPRYKVEPIGTKDIGEGGREREVWWTRQLRAGVSVGVGPP